MDEEKVVHEDKKMDEVSGGAAAGGKYCPFTTDRTCRLGISFDNDDERCKYCGWRAW